MTIKHLYNLVSLAVGLTLLCGAASTSAQTPAQAASRAANKTAPVLIGFDGAYGQKTNTAPIAIELGAKAAIDEVNRAGGVLGGRPLQLVTTDNKGVSARGKDNFIELASMKDMVAVLEGKYSPVSVEVLPDAHRLKVPMISVWGSADAITDNDYKPSYAFRVSLKDEWGVQAMMERLARKHKAEKACAFMPNTAWGRSAEAVMKTRAGKHAVRFPVVRWYNWGETSFAEPYQSCLTAGAQALLFVGNEKEAAVLLRDMVRLPSAQRLPVVAHWGVVGGVLHELVGDALEQVNLEVIQTFTFMGNTRPQAKRLADWIREHSDYKTVAAILSPVGAAHAYDTVHLLALALAKAKSTDPARVRDALEQLPAYNGVVRDYSRPFSPTRHDALGPQQLLFVRLTPAGVLVPVP